jgi:pyruvate formate lyase activating enzyme
MQIGGLQKLTLIDYPGKIAATVFCLGCSFRCPWCYNPELVLPEKIKKQPQISEKEFFFFLKERKNFLEGVCIGGGEPTVYEDLPEFIKKIKDLGYLIKLDTNGSNPEMLKDLIYSELVDYVAMDIKAPKEKYNDLIGNVKNSQEIIENIQFSIDILNQNKVDYEFRTTLIPVLLNKEDILEIARWIQPAKKYFLQNFQPTKTIDPDFEKIQPYPQDYLLEIKQAIEPFFQICQVR